MLKSLFRFSAIFSSISIITIALTSCIASKSNLLELINNQSGQISSQRQLYVIDDQIYYQTDKGFYQNNSQGKNIKIHDLNLTSCYKRDNWIYAMTNIANSAGYNTGNYLYDFILRFTTSGEIETVVDQAVSNVFYTEQKMFFSSFESQTEEYAIYSCDYSGENITKLYQGKVGCWLATNESILFIESDSNEGLTYLNQMDHEGQNKKNICVVSEREDGILSGSRVTTIMTLDSEIYFIYTLLDEDGEGPPTTQLFYVSNSNRKEIIEKNGLISFLLYDNKIYARDSHNIVCYGSKGEEAKIIYQNSTSSILSPYISGGYIYFILKSDKKEGVGRVKIANNEFELIIDNLYKETNISYLNKNIPAAPPVLRGI